MCNKAVKIFFSIFTSDAGNGVSGLQISKIFRGGMVFPNATVRLLAGSAPGGSREKLMLHIGARVSETLSYTDIGVNTLCYI